MFVDLFDCQRGTFRYMGGRGRALLSLSFILQFTRLYSVMIVDTLRQGVNFTIKDQLVSSSREFSLNFFYYPPTPTLYLGVSFSAGTVWVANQNQPIDGSFARVIIDDYGNLKIFYNEAAYILVYESEAPQAITASATLLDSGNFVLIETYNGGSANQVLWQSFDYPNNILLPGMRLGINWDTGQKWSLTSWVGLNTPAQGSFTLGMDPNNKNQLVIWCRGIIYWTSGLLKNGTFSNLSTAPGQSNPNFTYFSTGSEAFFRYYYSMRTTSADIFYIGLNPEGQLYGKVFVSCNTGNSVLSSGCVHQKPPNCRNPQTYISLLDFRYGNMSGTGYEIDRSEKLSLYDCGIMCMNNCSCVAYSSTTNDSTSCEMWTGENKFIASSHGRPVYFIKDSSTANIGGKSIGILSRLLIICIGGGAFLIFISFCVCYMSWRKCSIEAEIRLEENELFDGIDAVEIQSNPSREGRNFSKVEETSNEIHLFRFESIAMATNNFSAENKLGEGGSGPVYKGELFDGQEIAIKRLSNSSRHGLMEIKNEVKLIAKVQHNNVVRLHGLCIENGEKMLIYEYMPNRSLNFHLFDPDKKVLLNWKRRFGIIHGIAQGLVYLHEYSRLRIIHLHLKASSILLDYEMNPKISDFRIARIFGLNGSEKNIGNVVGISGYISLEYALYGVVSTKTDVFSFGVLLLEIVSGKRNGSCYSSDYPVYLIGYAWQLWNEGRALQLTDTTLDETCAANEIIKCIHIGLLCVQDLAEDRPTMLDVVSYLTNQAALVAEPKEPAFFRSLAVKEHALPNNKQENNLLMMKQ